MLVSSNEYPVRPKRTEDHQHTHTHTHTHGRRWIRANNCKAGRSITRKNRKALDIQCHRVEKTVRPPTNWPAAGVCPRDLVSTLITGEGRACGEKRRKGAMMSGFGMPRMIRTSCHTHSVQVIAMSCNRKVLCLAAATKRAVGGGGGRTLCERRRNCGMGRARGRGGEEPCLRTVGSGAMQTHLCRNQTRPPLLSTSTADRMAPRTPRQASEQSKQQKSCHEVIRLGAFQKKFVTQKDTHTHTHTHTIRTAKTRTEQEKR